MLQKTFYRSWSFKHLFYLKSCTYTKNTSFNLGIEQQLSIISLKTNNTIKLTFVKYSSWNYKQMYNFDQIVYIILDKFYGFC